MRDASFTCATARWTVTPYNTDSARSTNARRLDSLSSADVHTQVAFGKRVGGALGRLVYSRDALALCRFAGLLSALASHVVAAAPPYLTGIVDDADSQVIEMPRLPGMWQRQVAWLAPEGSTVVPGDLVVRLDPGDLVAQEEAAQKDLEHHRLQAERRLAETMLGILDAETAVVEAESAVRLAGIDAEIPAHATRQLDYDQDQLDLATAEQALARARAALADKKEQHAEAQPVTEMAIARAEAHAERLRDAITRTEIHADREGLFIHGENPFTGTKIFAGETLPPTIKIAEVASRNALRFRFWVHEADILGVPAKTPIVVTADAIPSLSIAATVDWTSKQATARNEWSQGGYFELLAVPTEAVPPNLVPGMAVMAAVRP